LANQINVGIRRLVWSLTPQPQERAYQPHGGQLYKTMSAKLRYAGSEYSRGATIPYDGGGGTVYSNDFWMGRLFRSGFVDPVN
jgi:hypothetical protein